MTVEYALSDEEKVQKSVIELLQPFVKFFPDFLEDRESFASGDVEPLSRFSGDRNEIVFRLFGAFVDYLARNNDALKHSLSTQENISKGGYARGISYLAEFAAGAP